MMRHSTLVPYFLGGMCVLKGESWDKMSNWNRKYKRPIQGENYWFTDKEFDDSAFSFILKLGLKIGLAMQQKLSLI